MLRDCLWGMTTRHCLIINNTLDDAAGAKRKTRARHKASAKKQAGPPPLACCANFSFVSSQPALTGVVQCCTSSIARVLVLNPGVAFARPYREGLHKPFGDAKRTTMINTVAYTQPPSSQQLYIIQTATLLWTLVAANMFSTKAQKGKYPRPHQLLTAPPRIIVY